MKTNEYLYGENVNVPEIPNGIIEQRVELLKANLEKLLEHSYHTRDNNRVTATFDAIKFWENINDK